MKIIAEQKDYYDCIMRNAMDRSIVYIRKPEERYLDSWPFPTFKSHVYKPHIIGFCGKIYPMILMKTSECRWDTELKRYVPGVSVKCFNIEAIDAFVEKYFDKCQLKEYYGKYCLIWFRFTRKECVRFFNQCYEQQNNFAYLFEEKKCPIFVCHKDVWRKPEIVIEWNALLSKYDFFRVFDPYQAFQEIAMFVGNLAISQNPMPVISDEMKVQTHGFDEFSFRKPKSK